mgnify:CR=1 FL=1
MAKTKEERLQDAFEYVRKIFFPRWDRGRKWKVVYTPRFKKRRIEAVCHSNIREIWFYTISKYDEMLRSCLVHEICHVNTWGHGKNWLANMERAYQRGLADPSVSGTLSAFIDHDRRREYRSEKYRTGKR